MKVMDLSQMLKDAEARHIEQQKEWDGDRPFKPSIKFYKKLEVFKASNVFFDPKTIEATSYDWWYFVKMISGRVVFNNYSYSPSTAKHQSKVRSLLDQLGIEIDLEIKAPKGLQDPHSAIDFYNREIADLREAIAMPRSRKGTNLRREAAIERLQAKIKVVERLVGLNREKYQRAA